MPSRKQPFIARYDGTCSGCFDEIVEGVDEIVMTDDGAVHHECRDDESDPVTFPL